MTVQDNRLVLICFGMERGGVGCYRFQEIFEKICRLVY